MKFNFRELTHSPERLNVITTKLGAAAGEGFKTSADAGKPMTMGKLGNHVIAADGADIEGFLDNVDDGPTADKFIVGGVARCNSGTRKLVEVEGAADVLDLVVAGTNAVAGTKNGKGAGIVRKVASEEGQTHKWRIIAFMTDAESTTGGELAVIEKL